MLTGIHFLIESIRTTANIQDLAVPVNIHSLRYVASEAVDSAMENLNTMFANSNTTPHQYVVKSRDAEQCMQPHQHIIDSPTKNLWFNTSLNWVSIASSLIAISNILQNIADYLRIAPLSAKSKACTKQAAFVNFLYFFVEEIERSVAEQWSWDRASMIFVQSWQHSPLWFPRQVTDIML